MQNVSFSTNAPEVKPPTMDRLMEQIRGFLHTQPGLMRTAVIGVCGVLLVLFVLRPVAREVSATLREPILLEAKTPHAEVLARSDEQLLSPEIESGGDAHLTRSKNKSYQLQQGILEQVS